MDEAKTVSLVFSGGLGLGAYHGGAYEAFSASSRSLHWITGSSAGAITAALIAGGPPDEAIARLRSYWNHSPALQADAPTLSARLFGSSGHFHLQSPWSPFAFRSLYDMEPTRQRLNELVDFSRLNAGDLRITIAATDLKSGNPVLFDSLKQPIQMDHILASCGFLPEFAPVSIDGRWVGDGGLSLNAPFDPVLERGEPPLRLFVLDLYARDGHPPDGLEAALERKNDLMFGNQTFQRLKYAVENRALRSRLRNRPVTHDRVYLLSYRPGREEAGPEKSFDFSRTAIAQRWRAGFLDMQQAASSHELAHGIRVVRRRSSFDPVLASNQPIRLAGARGT